MDLAGANSSGSFSRRRFGGDDVGCPPGGAGVDLVALGDERYTLVYDMFRFIGNERGVGLSRRCHFLSCCRRPRSPCGNFFAV